jgi:uncharacterized protein YbjT (DUF2867 family)
MFGPDDAFLVPLLKMLRRLPAFPLFGAGDTRLQPAYVEDVGEAVGRILRTAALHRAYELAGPRVYSYRELLQTIAAVAGRQPILVPFPFALWRAIEHASEFLPNPPITANQVDLMERDNIPGFGAPGFAALGITAASIEQMLPEILDTVGRSEGSAAAGH